MYSLGIESLDISDEHEAWERASELQADLNAVADRIIVSCGVSQADIASIESICPGLVSDQFPLESYSRTPSRSNYQLSLEFIDTNNKVLMAGVIGAGLALVAKIIHWLWQYFTGKSDDAANGAASVAGAAEKQADENLTLAKQKNPKDVATAESGAAEEVLEKHHITKLMNAIHSPGGRNTELVSDVLSLLDLTDEFIKHAKLEFNALEEENIFAIPVAGNGSEMATALKNIERSKVMAGYDPSWMAPSAQIIKRYSDPVYDISADGNSLVEGGKALNAYLHKLHGEAGTNINLAELTNDFRKFKWDAFKPKFRANIGKACEDINKQIVEAEEALKEAFEENPDMPAGAAVRQQVNTTIRRMREYTGMAAQIAQATLIIIRELEALAKLSKAFEDKFHSKLKALADYGDTYSAIANAGK